MGCPPRGASDAVAPAGGFLIPYLIMLIAEGMPLLYLELAVGQRMRQGSIGAWRIISPYLCGVGMCSAVLCPPERLGSTQAVRMGSFGCQGKNQVGAVFFLGLTGLSKELSRHFVQHWPWSQTPSHCAGSLDSEV